MDRREKAAKVEKALNEVMVEFDEYEEGDILVEWATICYVTNPDKEQGDAYPILYSNGIIPQYRARGLFETALLSLALDNSEEEDNEE